ncbi:uncharacterized protein LOC112575182 [Pomacea canaliculata]|uniref:uncharacterized protein LOC112575182 n=1 Tax=Pomacea canaliculata TaxID=400727 RepID=UPI000D72B8CE|nr:uncharacterized protein LOC112575182 [Pomacea canaliculata]
MLSTTINTFLLVTCIHIVTVISQGGNITCTVPPTHMFQDAVLTCNFPEDLNVTKKDFTVYHYLDHNADAVVDCWWLRGNMSCSAKPNVQYQRSVNTTFNITLVNVSSTHAGTYACQFVDNDPKIIQKCHLEILIALSEDSGHISVIGLSLGLLAAVVLVAGAIVLYIMYRR